MSSDLVLVPVFPLSGLVLFPHTRQLLHIFEERYRQMTQDALDGDGMIGLVLPRENAGEGSEPVPVYSIGCLGRITASRKLADGRFLILLEGRTRFEIQGEEQTPKLYRVVRARLLEDLEFDELAPHDQAALERARGDLESRMLDLTSALDPASVAALEDQMRQLDPIQLTHALAFGLECSGVEKQVLLEASDPVERCRQLIGLLDFHRIESRLPDAPRTLN